MSNLAPSAATARVPEGTVRLVAALTVLSWFGMIIHDRISLPELSLLSPDVVLPTVVSVALFAAWWVWPGRLSFGLLFGWTLLHFAVGGLVSVLASPGVAYPVHGLAEAKVVQHRSGSLGAVVEGVAATGVATGPMA